MRAIFLLFSIALYILPAPATEFFVADSIAQTFARRTLDPVEGVWQWPDDGAVMLIQRHSATSFVISLLDSPKADIAPGTVVGKLISSPKQDEYDCHIDPSGLGNGKARSADCLAVITNDNHLIFKPYRRTDTFSLRRFIPYLLRVGFLRGNRPTDIDGARRIFPSSHPASDITL